MNKEIILVLKKKKTPKQQKCRGPCGFTGEFYQPPSATTHLKKN